MSTGLVLVLDNNLFLRPRLQSDLEADGWRVVFAPGADRFRSALAENPAVVLVNLAARGIDWESLVAESRRLLPGTAVVGFGPHVDEVLAARGRAAGCADVVPNGAVAKSAARVVSRHL